MNQTVFFCELKRHCYDEIIQLLNSDWVKRDNNIEAIAHYKCFLAEQHDHKASVTSDSNRELNISKASSLFEDAYEIAKKNLNQAHPVAVDVANIYSDFIYCALGSVDKALNIATEAHDKALSKLPELPEGLKNTANGRLECLSAKIDDWKNKFLCRDMKSSFYVWFYLKYNIFVTL